MKYRNKKLDLIVDGRYYHLEEGESAQNVVTWINSFAHQSSQVYGGNTVAIYTGEGTKYAAPCNFIWIDPRNNQIHVVTQEEFEKNFEEV